MRALVVVIGIAAGGASAAAPAQPAAAADERPPNVLLLSVDTLRADRLSGYGYRRPTSPHLDRLMAAGALFATARTVEPLTGPALTSMLTGLPPHEHGATRNGLRVRRGLPSLPRLLARRGYRTAAFVTNWPLRDRLSGLGEHFASYAEILTHRRWFGLVRREADAADARAAALAWLAENAEDGRPFLAWVHFSDPHAPYQMHAEFAARLGLARPGDAGRSDRYDTEVAFVDAEVGKLLAWLEARPELARRTVVAFCADHGESLGEHGDWGHGRTLYEPALRIPMTITWPGRVAPRRIAAPASLADLPATLLALIAPELAGRLPGYDWSGVLAGEQPPPADRVTFHQAHRGAALRSPDPAQVRRAGLLGVALARGGAKEWLDLAPARRRVFDLDTDPDERADRGGGAAPSAELAAWLAAVRDGLARAEDLPAGDLDAESAAKLRALGYLD